MKHTFFRSLPVAFLLLAACQTSLPEQPPKTADAPPPGGVLVHEEPGARCAPLGGTRELDCNTCSCTKDGWACTALACDDPGAEPVEPRAEPVEPRAEPVEPRAEPEPTEVCTPGQTVFVPNQRQTPSAVCDVMPPDCGPGMHLGTEGTCYLCVPNVAPSDRDSDCVCNDDGRWLCTERPAKGTERSAKG